ncbi:MAG: MATE family efflux transporter [Rubrimonas sp.]|uniref:MATE family efflux transporter n=1 Tax=Rubrimonas sp. TaxID=2036015 RepID=UPI002FDE94DC
MTALAAGGGLGARRVLAIAVPVVLSNAMAPIQGAVDTAVIGNLGDAAYLAGVGIGAEIFAVIFGVLNFLQISTSGLSAQALGGRDPRRVLNTLARALIIAVALAAVLIAAQAAVAAGGRAWFQASAEAEDLAARYLQVRIWGAPAELGNLALMGWFAGQEMTRRLFQLQLLVSCLNIALNLLFVLGLGMDVDGVALGTALANYAGLGYGLWMARGRARALMPEGWRPEATRLLRRDELLALMALNRDIFLRTLLLAGSFAWMMRLGSGLGDATLAANVVLWQFFIVAAYALDGFAIAAESLVGQAAGARDPAGLRRAAVATSVWAGVLAAAISAALLAVSGPVIDLFTNVADVRALARDYALWAALTPLAGVAAFQLDGIFVGATAAREMRNAMALAVAAYVPLAWAATETLGNAGLWASMHALLLARAGALLAVYPRVEARIGLAPRIG